jgi:hypothetical protein
MPKISDIEETPNPNAVKFILKEPVSNGVAHQFASIEAAQDDALAKSLFEVGQVVSIFYMDKMITVEKEELADWDDLLPTLAVPIRAAASTTDAGAAAAAAVGGSIAAALASSDDPRIVRINEILDEKVRPALGSHGTQRAHADDSLSGRVRQLPQLAVWNADGNRRHAQAGD